MPKANISYQYLMYENRYRVYDSRVGSLSYRINKKDENLTEGI
ncbi:hypothetical protein [Anaerosalibacter massiliensis]|uniref:Uncharacterized protein n=1 Tax=Anaerosalibacter massiliensis TaxID=1347392 RepID=A0A9X2S7B1_9FIRM|nr:hypothetical protein [Anaerosalibacter massiliensis]MCR2043996.1 hypothetical protein [Anaerosalibacter massiliensis]